MDNLPIPFFSTQLTHTAIREEALAAIARVYDSQWYVLGEEVRQFEQEYSTFNHVTHTVGVGNGLEALALTLRALNMGPGDEVIVPANTYIATWLAVTQVGAVPIPVEPCRSTSNIDPARIAEAITPRTRAILPVHLYGQPCQMAAIMTLARQHGFWVVEDNAQAQGATFAGQLTGSFGVANATSFYPTKNLGALGDAGAITTNDAALAQRLFALRSYGASTKYQHDIIGYNSRLDEIQAAVLRVKLRHLQVHTYQRQQIAAWYQRLLSGLPDLRLPDIIPTATSVWHLYVVHTTQRDALQRYLATHGIGTLVHYPVPPHQQPAYAQLHWPAGSFPITEELASTCLSLPLWPGMTQAMVTTIAQVIGDFYKSKSVAV